MMMALDSVRTGNMSINQVRNSTKKIPCQAYILSGLCKMFSSVLPKLLKSSSSHPTFCGFVSGNYNHHFNIIV